MKTAFVTGAATGIGEALVVKLQQEGWQVFAGYRSSAPQQARWYGQVSVVPVKCDITNVDEVVEAAALVSSKTSGCLDLLINNAGYSGSAGVIEAPVMDEYRKSMEINVYGPLNMIQVFMPLLRSGNGSNGNKGRLINNTSASVFMTIPMGSAYPVAKTALKCLTMHLRLEMAPFGVEVTALDTGGVETAMTALGDDVKAQQWNSIPEHLRSQYRAHFVDGATAVGNNFKFFHPDEFAEKVYKQIITARKLKPSYLIGPGVAVLPWLHRLLPVRVVEGIWARMFRRQD